MRFHLLVRRTSVFETGTFLYPVALTLIRTLSCGFLEFEKSVRGFVISDGYDELWQKNIAPLGNRITTLLFLRPKKIFRKKTKRGRITNASALLMEQSEEWETSKVCLLFENENETAPTEERANQFTKNSGLALA